MSRTGWIYKRCHRCGHQVAKNTCSACGSRGSSWVYVVDVAPVGLRRRQEKVGGFATRKAAQAAMFATVAASRMARESAAGHVTTGDYLREWLASVAAGGSIRPTTAKAYEVALWRLASGMPPGRSPGLRWRDLDFRLGRVTVERQLVRNGDHLEFAHPKTAAGHRTICLDAATIAALREHRRRQIGPGTHDAEGERLALVFARADGRPRDPDTVTHQFRVEAERAGMPRIRFHDLRHTHATIALQAAINPKVVQERLGHASVKVTLDTYTHVMPPLHQEAAALIAALVDSAG